MDYIVELKKLNILYVDDDEVLCSSTKNILSPLFNNVFIAENGEEAIEIFDNQKIHIVMMDVKMHNLSGIDVAKYMRDKDKNIPIFLVSSYTDVNELIEAIKLDLVDYIKKPFTFEKLLSTLFECLDKMKLKGNLKHILGENIFYDELSKKVFINNKDILLTKSEVKIIETLIKKRGQMVTYLEFINILDRELSESALKNIVYRLRSKLEGNSIKNLYNVGYMLD
ncbi:response regulator transcription factor [Aliarcobacter cryaerophilus]|jgi:DNA-binding response OmpR family regulator|uniref:Response regulator transcription factor n=2 Tax=Arcobacteraceae TaxID=2808963 RepID=A0AAU0P3Q0_9BACT|nr:response regulator transcription factor [Aliarcobacter cryaerophilus]WNL15753.1 response regulator transcription factor [Arcobacter sp. AZ-2023]WPD02874.1 response regulator transcription factor [Arcobacter sp. DSM 115972]